MLGLFPVSNDREWNLWFKIASNYYNYALNLGATGLNPPNLNDNKFILMKKTAYFSARSVVAHP